MKKQKHSNKRTIYQLQTYRSPGTTDEEFIKTEIMYMKMAVEGFRLE